MKKILLIVLLALLSAAPALAERMQVQGSALVQSNNIEQAFRDAKADALRKGLELQIGVMVKSKTIVVNSMVLNDEIQAKAQGYASIISIDSKKREGDVYYVTLTADFSADKIQATADDLAARLAQIRQERSKIIVAVTGANLEGTNLFDINNYLAEKMRLQGFAVVYDEKIMQYIEANYQKESEIDVNAAVRKLALNNYKAQTILRGSVKTVRVDKTAGAVWFTAIVRPNLQIIRTDSDDVDPFSNYYRASANNSYDAENKAWDIALQDAALQLGKRVVETVQDNQDDGDNMYDYLFRFKNVDSTKRAQIVELFSNNGCDILNETVAASGEYVFYVESAKKLSAIKTVITQNLMVNELPSIQTDGAKQTVYSF